MKKISGIFCAMIMSLCLFACSCGSHQTEEPTTTPADSVVVDSLAADTLVMLPVVDDTVEVAE